MFRPKTLTKGTEVQVPVVAERGCAFNSKTQANASLGISANTSTPVEPPHRQTEALDHIVGQATRAGEVALADRRLEGQDQRINPKCLASSSSQANAKEGKHVHFYMSQQPQLRQRGDAGSLHQPGIKDQVAETGAKEGTRGTEGQGVEVVKGALALAVNPVMISQLQFAFR